MGDGQIFKKLFGPFVNVEHAQLQIKHGFSCNAEEEMARFNDASMNGADRDLEDTLALYGAEFVPVALKRGKLCAHIEIFAERKNFGPVVVKSAAARVWVADKFEAEHVLNFAFLPIHSVNGIGQ